MKDLIQRHLSGIIVGIISAMVFLYFIQPVLNFIGRAIIKVGVVIGAAYVDEIFAKVAHLELFDYSFFLVSILVGAMGIAAFSSAVIIWRRPKETRDLRDETEGEKRATSTLTVGKKVLASILFLLLGLTSVAFVSTRIYQLSLISSFEQHIRVLAPLLSEQEEEVFISRWSQMRSEKDYDSIYKDLHKIAKDNQVDLPDNKIYSFTSL